jgi:hypothetical protein
MSNKISNYISNNQPISLSGGRLNRTENEMKTDENKNQQAVKIIAANIAKIEANLIKVTGASTPTFGLTTEREKEAKSMAQYIVTKLYKVELNHHIWENMNDEQKEAHELAVRIAAEAIAITGK